MTESSRGGAFRGKAQARGHATAVRPRCATLALRAKLPPIYLINKKQFAISLSLLSKPLPTNCFKLQTSVKLLDINIGN
jgi:hypothetical protein